MSHSNSSLNTFTNCMAKYEHNYILHTEPCKPPSPHLTFGTMAHEVLYKAGKLRDELADGLEPDYDIIIPSDLLYTDLQEAFEIKHWYTYFMPVINQIAKYEHNCIKELSWGNVQVERELKLQLTVDELKQYGFDNITQPVVGIIDLLIRNEDSAIILDYKFSTTKKTQSDFDMNSQLYLYALFVMNTYNIPLNNIQIGYIDIPKKEFSRPLILNNGTLSRAKSQNISQELYKQCILEAHGDDPYYNCDEGGYYYEAWCNFAINKPAYLNKQYIALDTYRGIIKDLMTTAQMIDFMTNNKMTFLHKFDSYSCSSCEYVNSCKPWLYPNYEYKE